LVRAAWRNRERGAVPTTGKLRGEAIQVRAEAVELDNVVHAFAKTIVGEAVNAAVEREIFRTVRSEYRLKFCDM